MSGGSFDYLYMKDAQGICGAKTHLREMADELQAMGAYEAYRDTIRILRLIESLEQAVDDNALMDVWHAIEWWKSGDWSLIQAATVAGEYKDRREQWHTRVEGAE